MKDTPPTGVYVARCMRRVLDNELYWVEWKNKACPATSFQPDSISQLPLPPPLPNQQPNPASNKRRFTPGETVSSKAILGSCTAKVDQIWETFKSNTTCKSSNDTNNHIDYFTGVPQEKIFLDFVEEAVEQCDPIAEIDMEYRIVNEDWWWRLATRICQRHSVKYKYKLSEIIGNSKAAMVQLLESMWKERNPEKVKQMAEEAAKAKAMKDKQLAELAAEEEKERLALEEAEKANKKAADEKLKQEQLKARLQEDKAKKDEAKAKLKEEAEIAKLENADENLKKETDTGKAGPGPDTLVSRRSSGAIKRESSIESGEESSNSQYGGGQSKTTISEYTKKPVSANTNTTSGTKRKADSNRIDSNSTMRSESDAKKLKADNGEARRKSIKGTDDLYKDAEIRAKDSDYKRSKESDREKSKDRRTNASDSRPTSRPSSRPASRRASSDRYSSDNTIGKTKDGDGSTFNSKGLGRNGANDDSIGVVQSQGAKNIRTKVKATERVRSSPSQTTITSASDSNHKLGSTGRTSSCASLGGESTGEKSDKYDNHDRSQSVGNRANSGNSVSMQHGTGISSMNSSSKSDATKAPPKSHIRKAESIGVRQASITARDTYAGVKHSTDSGSGEVDTEANQTQQKSNSRSNAQTPNGRMRNAAGGGSGGPGLVQRQLSDVMQQRQNRFQPQGKGSGSNVGSPVQSRGHLGEGNTNGRTHNTNQNDRGNANNSNNTSRRSSGVGSHSGKRDMRDGGTPERKKSKHY
ncbi:hypothetical protein, variant [Sphaeroforma arctica JP610]|nr:hypothetical protein, variant [Sphaeroforma arctica JP610]KNC87097.1 hypothetical protein, variant [Sphaeroforma arctica JP610]|eukprot:XP_014160999.1 hypothetical protein, variant [Sphaeroforma arctica JP610]